MKMFYTYAMLILIGFPKHYLVKILKLYMLSHAMFWKETHVEILQRLRKGVVIYIIKQGLNEPPRWKILEVLEKVATKGTMSMAITLCCAPNENHLGNLEIEHVSPIVAFVCNHMLIWLWLGELHWEDPCTVFI